jgi:hypothetical protein
MPDSEARMPGARATSRRVESLQARTPSFCDQTTAMDRAGLRFSLVDR